MTISLPDAKDVVLKTDAKGLFTLSAVAHGEPFSFTLELFGSVLPEVSNCCLMLFFKKSNCWLMSWISIRAQFQQMSNEIRCLSLELLAAA